MDKSITDLIDKYYPPGSEGREIFLKHSGQVAALAVEIARRRHLPLDLDEVCAAAMLHDIGICLTSASDIGCHGTEPYIRHGVLGAELIRSHGLPEIYARVAERHTGSGITPTDIRLQNLPLDPTVDYMPRTLLERLICYADKFYSKSGDLALKPLAKVRASLGRISSETLDRFDTLHAYFSPE